MLVGYPPFFDDTARGIYEKVISGRIHWPRDMDGLSRDLIRAFLHPDRSKRLGNLIGGSEDVLEHPWFRGVDWDSLERCEIGVWSSRITLFFSFRIDRLRTQAPILPHVSSADDTRHFSNLPLPAIEDIPGLIPSDMPNVDLPNGIDQFDYKFLEF
jgi:hypothetical protein